MSENNHKEIESRISDKTLEERISILSTTAHENLRDPAACSMDLLYTEAGHAFIRKRSKITEENSKKYYCRRTDRERLRMNCLVKKA
jgi:hypothetical protein